ncbi:MAG: hypothetical protein FWF50_01370 [Defluviitaleaceae bacterium]|nr:hypothetical protein [Defluviitaleaceae bacterium]
MASISNKELVAEQRRRLYPLVYALRAPTEEERIKVLQDTIDALIAEMDEEDVAFIEKQVQKKIK